MRPLLATLLLSLCAGCLTPRSVALGNTAAALGPGNHEVAVTTGFTWQTETAAPIDTETNTGITRTSTTAAGIQFPAAEANVQFGLTKLFGLNLHLSPAGIQPGLKLTLLKRGVIVGLLPELGFGWGNGASQVITFVNQSRTDGDPAFNNFILLNAGLRALLFHPGSGVYAGAGYQLESFIFRTSQGSGANEARSSSSTTLHNILVAFGYEIKTGSLRIRPELAVSITPERGTTAQLNNDPAVSRSGGNALFFFPNVTFAIEGQAGASREGEEAADEDEARERRREDGETEDEDADDLDENARVRKRVKPPPKEEEETPPTRRKTTKIESDDEEKPAPKKEEAEESTDDTE